MIPSKATSTQITDWRKRMTWKRAWAAQRLGLSLSTYTNYERGSRSDKGEVSIPLVVALACSALENKLKPLGE